MAAPQDYWHGIPFGEWILVDRKGVPPKTSNMVWSAWIQSRNRIWQARLHQSIYEAGGRPLYGDTDSSLAWLKNSRLAVQIQASQHLKTKMIPIHTAELLSPKVYRMETMDKKVILSTKGVPRRFITAATVLGEDTITGETPDTFFQLLKANQANNVLKNKWSTKTWKFRAINRNRRTFHDDPWTQSLTAVNGKIILTRRKKTQLQVKQ